MPKIIEQSIHCSLFIIQAALTVHSQAISNMNLKMVSLLFNLLLVEMIFRRLVIN